MNFLLSSLIFFMALTTHSVGAGETENADLSGPLTRTELEKPGYPWLKNGERKAAREYARNRSALETLAKKLGTADIEIYLGTWCGDSQEHVPPFLALLDETKKATKVAPKSLKIFALTTKRTYDGYTNPRKIDRYPTFVFFRDGKEIGRIIETPKKSVLDDTLAITQSDE